MKRRKRLVSMLLACCLLVTLFPPAGLALEITSQAAGGERTAEDAPYENSAVDPVYAVRDEVSVAPVGELASKDNEVAYPVVGGSLYFDASTGTITNCDESVTVANIPSVIGDVSVTSIGDSAFEDCSSLTSVTIPDSVTDIDREAFGYCISLTSVTIPDSVTSIDHYAFADCTSLTSIDIPDSVRSIGGPGLVGNSLFTFGGTVFVGCSSLTSIDVSLGNSNYCSVDGVLFTKDMTELVRYPEANPVKNYVIPDSVTRIASYAFDGCSSLTSVTIPDSVTDIHNFAFSGCSSLASVTIPNGVTAIYAWAFFDCSSLTSVSIPDSVTYIDWHAFSDCSSLTNVIISDSVTDISDVFSGCSSLTNVIIPDSVTDISGAFSGCSSLTSVSIPDSVTYIDAHTFSDCSSLTDVYYAGSEADWAAISISYDNAELASATIHYNSVGPDNTNSDDTETTNSSVRFFSSWNPDTKLALFDGEIYGFFGYQATEETDMSFEDILVQLLNKYVLVESRPGETSSTLLSIKPVDSKIGIVRDVIVGNGDPAVTSLQFDDGTYAVAAGLITYDGLIGKNVLYHLYAGEICEFEVLEEKTGTVGDWNSATSTVNIDGADFHTNYMTDLESLAAISEIADKNQTIIYYFAGDALLKAEIGQESEDPPYEFYSTKIGILTAYDSDALVLQIDGTDFPIQDNETVKDELEENLRDAIGKKAVFVVTGGEVTYAMPLERVSTRLEAIVKAEPSTIAYQDEYDRTSIIAEVDVRNVYDVHPWVDTNMLKTAIAQNVPNWNGDIALDHVDFEITWGASEQGGHSVEKFMVFSDGAYEDRFLFNDCKTTVENTATLSLNESATISANIAVNPDYSHDNSEFADDFPKGVTEKTAQVSVEAEGRRADGERLRNSSFCSIIAQYPNNILTEEEIDEITVEAGEELEKIDGALSLNWNTMYTIFGLEGAALDQLEKEMLSVIVMSNIPEETLKEKLSSHIVDRVLGTYIPNEITAGTYTVPLVYEIATPKSKYGEVTVQFNCEVHTYNLHGTNFALWVTVTYEILRSERPVRPDQASGSLGQGTRTNVGAFSSAAYSLAEAELKKQYNEVWGNSANRVADFLFGDVVKMILEKTNTTVKDKVWELIVRPTTNTKIDCPVNVYVYNQSGVLCGSIENNVVTQSSDVFGLSVEGETKFITDLEDLYTIQYVATDNGTMDITLTEFSSYETPARQIAFYDVPLIKDQSYTQNIPEPIQSATEEYQLLASDGTVVPADTDQSLLNLTPSAAPPSDPETPSGDSSVSGGSSSSGSSSSGSSGGSSSGGGTINYTVSVEQSSGGAIRVNPTRAERGDTVTITADPDTGYELNRVTVTNSSGGEIDVERQSDTEYTFVMPGRRVIVEAVFTEIPEEPEPEPEPEPAALPFTDVGTGDWYCDAVRFVYERGMMAGTGDNRFSPNLTTTRAMIVTILYRLENQPSAGSAGFTDVPTGQWYSSAVAWAADNGIVGGYGDGRFGPNDTITREQFAVMLWRYAGHPTAATNELNFNDVGEISDWALDALHWAVELGIINGKGGGVLDPQGQATRAEAAQMLKNYIA